MFRRPDDLPSDRDATLTLFCPEAGRLPDLHVPGRVLLNLLDIDPRGVYRIREGLVTRIDVVALAHS